MWCFSPLLCAFSVILTSSICVIQPITDGRSLGIDIPSHVSTGGGQSVTSPLPSTAAANSHANTFVDDPPIGNTDNNYYSESVQANFLNANVNDEEEKTVGEESSSRRRSSRRTNNKA